MNDVDVSMDISVPALKARLRVLVEVSGDFS